MQVLALCGKQGWGDFPASVDRLYGTLDTDVGKQRLYVEGHHDLVVLDLLTTDNEYTVS